MLERARDGEVWIEDFRDGEPVLSQSEPHPVGLHFALKSWSRQIARLSPDRWTQGMRAALEHSNEGPLKKGEPARGQRTAAARSR
jgi:hypothetical protein